MRFIHISDVNLSLKEEYKASYEAFNLILKKCREDKVDLLLISGDLFLSHPTINEIREFKLALTKILTTNIVILAGDHDFLNDRSRIYEALADRRVMLLDAAADATLLVPEAGAVIYGASYNRKSQDVSALSAIHTYRTKGLHIYMGHGEIPDIERDSFDYIAMGGKGEFEKVSENAYYPGKGTHGYIKGELTKGNLNAEYVAFTESFDIAGREDEEVEPSALKEYDELRIKYDELRANLERSNGIIKANEKEAEGGSKALTMARYAGVVFASAVVYALLSNLIPGITALGAGAGLLVLGLLLIASLGREKKAKAEAEVKNNERLRDEMKELSDKLLEYEKNFDTLNYPEA